MNHASARSNLAGCRLRRPKSNTLNLFLMEGLEHDRAVVIGQTVDKGIGWVGGTQRALRQPGVRPGSWDMHQILWRDVSVPPGVRRSDYRSSSSNARTMWVIVTLTIDDTCTEGAGRRCVGSVVEPRRLSAGTY